MRPVFLLHSLLLGLVVFSAAPDALIASGSDRLVLRNCAVFTGTDPEVMPGQSVRIQDGRIESIRARDTPAPEGWEEIDCGGHTLIPGLIDVHTHLDTTEQAARALASGTTTVRTAGVPAFQDVGLASLVRSGALPGPDVVAAGVDEAARHGLTVMAHAHGDEGARAAVEAGVRSIEHGTYLSTETLQRMKEKGTWFVPTLVTMWEMHEEQYDHVLRLRAQHMVPRLEQAVREAHRLGVKFATGADNYYDNESINRISLEVMHLTRLGLSPFEALQAATVSSAELLGLGDRTGRIAAGYEADLVLVPGNPLEDVSVLQDPLVVVSNGRLVLRRIPFALPDEN